MIHFFLDSKRLVGMIQYLGGASTTYIGVYMPSRKRFDDATFGSTAENDTFCKKTILDPKVASSTLFQGAIQTPIYVVEAPPRYWIMSTSLLELEKSVFRVIWCIWVPFWVIWILVKKSKFLDFSAENAWKTDPIAPFKRKKGCKNAFQALNFFSSKKICKNRCVLHSLRVSNSKCRDRSGGFAGADSRKIFQIFLWKPFFQRNFFAWKLV